MGTTRGDNGVSIERSADLGKRFYRDEHVGFYAAASDRKMTENGDCRQPTVKVPGGGGAGGGRVVAKGTPEEIADTKGSYTGEYLAKVLKRHHAKNRSTKE